MAKKIKWVPTDHPINKPEKSGIEENFQEDQIKEKEQEQSDEYDDWLIQQIMDENQPDFWWIY